jgi:putative ABC transport system permease protein
MNQLMQDIRFSLRQMRKAPGFAAVVVLTLSLGIGAATAVFSVVDAVLIRPLPYAHQERLVMPVLTARTGETLPSSYLGYLDVRAQLRTFDAFAGWSMFGNLNLEGPNGPVSLRAVKSTDNLFDVLGVKPLLGRAFLPGEDQPGKDDVVVLSYEVWQTNFGGQADAVGKVVRLDGVPYTVIGVMPPAFRFPLGAINAIYTPLHTNPVWAQARGMHWMRTVGLLKPGVSVQQGQADMLNAMANLARVWPQQEAGHGGILLPLNVAFTSLDAFGKHTLKGPLGTLGLAVLALLGIACVNVAGLLMARGVKREREVALRAAVGASRSRLVRQMLTESLVLCVCGLGGGIFVSWILLKAMNVFLVKAMSQGPDVHLNLVVVAVALGLSMLTSVLASLLPATRLSGADPNHALRAGGGAGTGRGQHRLRSGFVVTQVALSLVLLVVSGLLLRNLQGQLKTDLGVDANAILTTRLNLSHGRYEHRDPLLTFYQPLIEKVSHLPGVAAAGLIDILPIEGWGDGYGIHITGQPPYPPNEEMAAETRFVSPGYFAAMGLKLTGGRLLSSSLDKADNVAGTMVVNEAFRRKFFSNGGDPVGAHIDNADKAENKSAIVGVVSNVRQDLQSAPMAEMDWLMDEVDPNRRLNDLGGMTLVVRSSGNLQALIPSLRNAVHDIDPTVPFPMPVTMDQVVSDRLMLERLEGWLFGIFAAFALLLAVIGLYGLINHEVELRTREIGIRMALGSTRSLVLGNVLRRVSLLMVTGIAVGLLLTGALQKVLSSVVEIHAAKDARLLCMLALGLVIAGVLAGVLPAHRAASVEPTDALRME